MGRRLAALGPAWSFWGPYRLVERLGAGGMGAIYRAVYEKAGRAVAIKLLHRSMRRETVALSRFFHEARAVNTIRHPNVVELYDLSGDGEDVYMVLELLHGQDLRALLQDEPGGRLMPERAVMLLEQICGALQAAHANKIIHRDLKPENVFVVQREGQPERVKLLDFGIAKLEQAEGRLTSEGMAMGTPEYMSPEQARGSEVDGRADIYAVGCMAFEMLTGRDAVPGADRRRRYGPAGARGAEVAARAEPGAARDAGGGGVALPGQVAPGPVPDRAGRGPGVQRRAERALRPHGRLRQLADLGQPQRFGERRRLAGAHPARVVRTAGSLASGKRSDMASNADGQPTTAEEMETMRVAEAQPGDVVGSYRVLRLIGEGAVGRVFEVEHVKIGRRAAMKVLSPEHALRPLAVRRLFAEAQAVNRINDPHIVEITDVVDADRPGGASGVVMELLEGQSLAHLLIKEGPVPPERFIPILIQVADALSAAHAAGFVHRDLKPENIFLTERHGETDYVKLLDFGLAKSLAPDPAATSVHRCAGIAGAAPPATRPSRAPSWARRPTPRPSRPRASRWIAGPTCIRWA